MLVLYLFLVLQRVAFYTLLERHILGITQNRFGPKKTSWFGLVQPILDGLKLCKKEQILTFHCRPRVFLGVTLLNFTLFYMEFICLPYWFLFITINWSYIVIIVLVRVNVYFLLYGGVYSKSKYRYLGGVRRRVARVSYEVIFRLNIVVFMLYRKSYTLEPLGNLGLVLMFVVFFIRVLVELGRTPFDYSERESELVRGFNTEYRRVGFVLLFLKEYGRLIFFSLMTSNVFARGSFIVSVIIFRLFILVRSSFPRFRYDKLIGIMWLQLFFHVSVVLYATFYLLLYGA